MCLSSHQFSPSSRLETVGEVTGEGVQTLGTQEGDEVFVRQKLPQCLDHENKSLARRLRLADQRMLLVGTFSIVAQQRR